MTAHPVSQALEDEIAGTLRARGIVVWLDAREHYTGFVDELARRHEAREFAYPVVGYRGSFLEQMLALERYGSHLDMQPLLIHMPGFNRESIVGTPIFELYKSGLAWEKALATLVREVATGEVEAGLIEAFVGSAELDLESADHWLASHAGSTASGIAARLKLLDFSTLVDQLLGDGRLIGSIVTAADADALEDHLRVQSGMDRAWRRFCGEATQPSQRERVQTIVDAFGSWLLCLEFVLDLTREPRMPELVPLGRLSKPLATRCLEALRQFRERRPEQYIQLAGDVEERIRRERDSVRPEELGRIDTFSFEEIMIFEGALEALGAADYQLARDWSTERVGEDAFWVRQDPARQWEWQVVDAAANLGIRLDAAPRPLEPARDLADAIEIYTRDAASIDAAHRRFEQTCEQKLEVRSLHYSQLRALRDQLRRAYRTWADQLASDFASLCRDHGPLAGSELSQRCLFDEVVAPLISADRGPVAVFLIDALRFELARDLAAELDGGGTTIRLDARYAELPTITSVGMNALPPVARDGRLEPVISKKAGISGFRSGEFSVTGVAARVRQMQSRAGATVSMTLAEASSSTTKTLKRRVKRDTKLVVVHSVEVDAAGESGFLHGTIERTIRSVTEAWHQLQQVGVRSFVFTADHGFLLQDDTTARRRFGKKTTPHRRHIVYDSPVNEADMLTVPFTALGYDGPERYLLFRTDTAVFDTPGSDAAFVHGGNSLQERVIPVLVASRKQAPGTVASSFEVRAKKLDDVLGAQRVSVVVLPQLHAPASLPFTGAKTVELGLRVRDRPDVEVIVRDAAGAARLNGGRLVVSVGDRASEVFFVLRGAVDEQVAVEVFHPGGAEEVAPEVVKWFSVAGRRKQEPSEEPAPEPAWDDAIADEGFRRVFVHLEQHGAINEGELLTLLGTPRRVRAFARRFDELVELVPFAVAIETIGVMKRYKKEGG